MIPAINYGGVVPEFSELGCNSSGIERHHPRSILAKAVFDCELQDSNG